MGKGVRGRDRPYPEFSPRYGERERRSGWGVAPPSRKLWVGNLSSHITENILSEQFLRFGDIESIAYLPGRSYAYVNFKKEEDAVLALRALHGSNIAGLPIRIEFAKGGMFGATAAVLPQEAAVGILLREVDCLFIAAV